eukprot:1155282-Pelagomonas_calceolata.AAC.11
MHCARWGAGWCARWGCCLMAGQCGWRCIVDASWRLMHCARWGAGWCARWGCCIVAAGRRVVCADGLPPSWQVLGRAEEATKRLSFCTGKTPKSSGCSTLVTMLSSCHLTRGLMHHAQRDGDGHSGAAASWQMHCGDLGRGCIVDATRRAGELGSRCAADAIGRLVSMGGEDSLMQQGEVVGRVFLPSHAPWCTMVSWHGDASSMQHGEQVRCTGVSFARRQDAGSGQFAGAGALQHEDKLWSGLKELADGIVTSTTAVWHLQRVVAKKKVCVCARVQKSWHKSGQTSLVKLF